MGAEVTITAGSGGVTLLSPVPRRPPEETVPLRNSAPYSAHSEVASSAGRPKRRRDYDDYNSSGDELDDDDFDR